MKVTALALLGTLVAIPALSLADDNASGAYVGGAFGRFNLHIEHLDDVDDAAQTIAHSDNNSWKAFVGYRFTPNWSIEAAYIDFGNSSDEFSSTGSDGNYRVRMKGFAPSLVGTIPVGPVELFGKVGEYFYNVDTRIDLDGAGSPRITSSHSRSDLVWGGGVGITVLEHLNLRAEYERIEIDNAQNSNALWLGAAWRF